MPDKDNDPIICRCNDVTESEVIEILRMGFTDIEEVKRLLRIGMGPCQGRTCIPLVMRIIARETGMNIEKINPPTSRPPIIPIPIEVAKRESD